MDKQVKEFKEYLEEMIKFTEFEYENNDERPMVHYFRGCQDVYRLVNERFNKIFNN